MSWLIKKLGDYMKFIVVGMIEGMGNFLEYCVNW
jgi:hypothetical protein